MTLPPTREELDMVSVNGTNYYRYRVFEQKTGRQVGSVWATRPDPYAALRNWNRRQVSPLKNDIQLFATFESRIVNEDCFTAYETGDVKAHSLQLWYEITQADTKVEPRRSLLNNSIKQCLGIQIQNYPPGCALLSVSDVQAVLSSGAEDF